LRHPNLATREHSGLLLVDLQPALLQAVQNGEAIVAAGQLLLQSAAILGIPALATTQNAARLGAIVPEIGELMPAPPSTRWRLAAAAPPASSTR